MSEQLKQEFEADIDCLEAGTTIDGEIIGNQEKGPAEGKIEDQEGNETNEADVVQMGKASLADIVSEIPAPTEAEIKAAEAENAKPVKQKAREKLEAEKKKAAQKNFADPVIAYLLKRCEEDQGLAEDVMQDSKTWSKCFNYIVEQARKQSNGRSTAVEDRVVYEWAEDYYHKYEKPETAKKEKGKKPATTKKTEAPAKKVAETKKDIQKPKDDTKISEKPVKKDAASKQRKAEKTSTKSSELSGQMSLFDLL